MAFIIISYLTIQAFSLWITSLFLKDSSLMDRFWGITFSFISLLSLLYQENSSTKLCIFIMAFIYGVRLSWHITKRNWGKGEDPRYTEMRVNTKNYPLVSLFTIFLGQGVFAFVISLPLWNFELTSSLPFLFIGSAIWLLGLSIEVLADLQLKKFKQNSSKDEVCDIGVWAFCRHPNYFGEWCIWVGLFMFSFQWQNFYNIASPLLLYYLLTRLTGIGPLEEEMIKKRSRYKEYIERVPSFWPSILSKKG